MHESALAPNQGAIYISMDLFCSPAAKHDATLMVTKANCNRTCRTTHRHQEVDRLQELAVDCSFILSKDFEPLRRIKTTVLVKMYNPVQ